MFIGFTEPFDHVSNNRRLDMADLNVINMPDKSKLVPFDNLVCNTWVIGIDLKSNGEDVGAKVLVI